MANSPRLRTSNPMGVRDVGLASSGGVVTRGSVAGDGSDAIQGQNSAPSPVTEEVLKGAGVKSHPQLMNAHQAGSVTADDAAHEAYLMDELTKQPATYKAEPTRNGVVVGQHPKGGAVYEGGRANPSSNSAYRK